jgi:GT2 family glycosyltransferase
MRTSDDTPRLTIAITCYSEGPWLKECWDSVLAQTDGRWTAVLVMDGTDHEPTRRVFASLNHPRLHKEMLPNNQGPYCAGNRAFELAQTPYVFWLDGDDLLVPNSVSMILDTFERAPEAGCVYGDLELFGGQTGIQRYAEHYTEEDFAHHRYPPGAFGVRRSVWERLGGFSIELARGMADCDFHFTAMEAGIVARHCVGVLYRYRIGHSSVSRSYRREYHTKTELILRRHPRLFKDTRLRDIFLAEGYLRAALANYETGAKRRGNQLLRIARRHRARGDREIWDVFLRANLPPVLYRAVRGLFRFFRRFCCPRVPERNFHDQ